VWDLLRYHANPLEITQLVFAVIGVLIAFLSLIDSAKDSVALSLSGINGPRRIVASTNFSAELERLVVQVLLMVIGIVSVLLPPPFSPGVVPGEEGLQPMIVRVILVVITVVKVFAGVSQRYARRKFTREWASGPSAALAPPPGFFESEIAKVTKKAKKTDTAIKDLGAKLKDTDEAAHRLEEKVARATEEKRPPTGP
jgi:hypothetical protein